MTHAPFLVIDGKLYRWKDILELRRAQQSGARSRVQGGAAPGCRPHGLGAAPLSTASVRWLPPC